MITKEIINRINELYKKQTTVGLTEGEKEEQQTLRKEYIDSFKENLKAQLENIEVVSPEEYEKKMKEHDDNCNCHHHH